MVVFVEQVSEQTDWQGGSAAFMDRPVRGDPAAIDPPGSDWSRATLAAGAHPKAARLALLNHVVATEILPRLALARRVANRSREGDVPNPTSYDDTGELVRLLLNQEETDAVGFIEALLSRGATPEALYIGILTDAARWLGLMWEDDRCDFTQVTIALGRLQKIARMLSPRFQTASVTRQYTATLLLQPAAGEQHTFGLLILAEFFQRAGWRVSGGPKSTGVDAAELVRQSWFDVVGFSIGSERFLDALATTIRRVRRESRNRAIVVLVGGPLFQQRPELATRAGADGIATDARAAVHLAGELLEACAVAE